MNNLHKYKQLVDLIYVSSVAEDEHLTRVEVRSIVNNGLRSKYLHGQPRRELVQAYGQKLAYDRLEQLAQMKKPVDVNTLLLIHQLIFKDIDIHAGEYRNQYVQLRSSALMPSFPFVIQADMEDFNRQIIKKQRDIDKEDMDQVVELVAFSYHGITKIHPFSDGNGRSARLFINLLLRRYGLPYIIIPKVANVGLMREVLRKADMGDLNPLIKYLTKALKVAIKRYQ